MDRMNRHKTMRFSGLDNSESMMISQSEDAQSSAISKLNEINSSAANAVACQDYEQFLSTSLIACSTMAKGIDDVLAENIISLIAEKAAIEQFQQKRNNQHNQKIVSGG